MAKKDIFRQGLGGFLTAAATFSIGVLSFAGMFVLSSSFALCGLAFVLAAAYESQVNGEGIDKALKRILDPHYLSLALVQNYLKEQLKTHTNENIFLANYREQKRYVKELDNYIDELEEELEELNKLHGINRLTNLFKRAKSLEEIETEQRIEEIKITLKKQKKLLEAEQHRLRNMEMSFLRQIQKPENDNASTMEKEIRKLFSDVQQQELLAEINKKRKYIKLGWLLAIGSGVASGLATISAMHVAIATFTVLSAIPGGIIITTCVLAAAGYTLLMYQNISDMIQEFSGKWKEFFYKRENETRGTHIARVTVSIAAVLLGIFATVATAGTWWSAVKDGAKILGAVEKVAAALQGFAVALMTIPTFIFNARNAIKSIEKISESHYGKLIRKTWGTIKETLKKENYFQNLNPIRLIETVFTLSARLILFVGHVLSMGLISDRLPFVSPKVSVPLNSSVEILADANYLAKEKNKHKNSQIEENNEEDNEEEHTHESKILTVLFSPIIVVTVALRFLSATWDWCGSLFSPNRSFKESLKKMFLKSDESEETPDADPAPAPINADYKHGAEDKKPSNLSAKKSDLEKKFSVTASTQAKLAKSPITQATPPQKASLTREWRKQEIIETCDQIIDQNKSQNKNKAAKRMRDLMIKNVNVDKKKLETDALPLAKHRYCNFWRSTETTSQREMKAALENYTSEKELGEGEEMRARSTFQMAMG
jgi:hypothetical protein